MLAFLFSIALPWLQPGLPSAAQDESFDSNGVEIHYTVTGDGPPMVVLHGFGGGQDMWRMFGTVDALAKDFQVITLDVRGHGRSEKPHETERYGLEMVEDVVRLLDHLDLEQAHVVGYSMGGMLALKLATLHPDRVTSVVLGGFGWYRFGAAGEDLMDRVADSLAAGKGVGPLMEALTPVGEAPPPPDQIEQMNRMLTQQNDVQALAACARSFRTLEVPEEALLACKVPMICVVGEKDRLKADVDRLIGLREDVEAVFVPGGNHMTTGLSPLFVNTIREFAGDHEPAAAR